MIFTLMCLIAVARAAEIDGSYASQDDDNKTWSDLSHRHRIKDSSYLMDRYPLGELPNDYVHCKRPAKCFRMSKATCMGVKLPYDTTSEDLIPEYTNQRIIREKLHVLQSLKHIPKCWSVVQPFLCSLFAPRCVNGSVDLPSQEMCRLISGPCAVVLNHTIWPSFVRCDDAALFPRRCKNDFRELKFDTRWQCLEPLVPTDNPLAVFEGLEGCGLPCNDPLYTNEEEKLIHSFILWAASVCFACNFFTMLTFVIDGRSSDKYPALSIFYMNCCFMIACTGWLVQFYAGNREFIVCRKDGTLRTSEPSGENLMCVVIFVLIYYSSMAAMVWFVIFTYTWHMSFNEVGNVQNKIKKKCSYFHLLAWCLPLILTVTVMAMGEIDGNYLTGICFVGYKNHVARACFVLAPITVVILVGGYFLFLGLIKLIDLKIGSRDFVTEKVSCKIRDNIIRMGLFSVFTLVAVILTFYCHVYDFQYSWTWKQSFREYIICSITSKYTDTVPECKMKVRPSAAKLQLHLLAPFFAGILMSSWIWTHSTLEIWIRFIRRIFNRETEEPLKLQKHKVIAQTFAKRKMFDNTGRLSISFHNTHQDPVGLNFDLNSVASQGFSSTWAAALPKLVSRRGALVDEPESSHHRNSLDSQYSFSMRHVSVESRRNSCDSQFAVSISEIKAELKTTGGKRPKKPLKRAKDRSLPYKRRRMFVRSRSSKAVAAGRDGNSTTSQESRPDVVAEAAGPNAVALPAPNLERRAGINERMLTRSDAKIYFPFLFSSNEKNSSENSESENTSPET